MVQTTKVTPKEPIGPKLDRELEEYRNLMEVPSTFDEGFSWRSLAGAIFIALIMVPGAIYMDLLAGQGIGGAAQWVTVILFVEIARRAQSQLKKSEIYTLFYMAGAAMSVPFFGLLWNQFYIQSQAAQAAGIAALLPHWIAPPLDSPSYAHRSFIALEWLPVIGYVAFTTIFSNLSNMVLGYGLFRLTSDVEKLPFPMAPVGAQGIMALAEEDSPDKGNGDHQRNWRMRIFAVGGAIGLAAGSVYLLLPIVTSALTGGTPIQLFAIPFRDTTAVTQQFLPAVATGMCWDLGNVILGMVLPFSAVLGGFIGVMTTVVANPILHNVGILKQWTPGDDTVTVIFKNHIDFYFSFGIGVALAIALIGIYQVIAGVQARRKAAKLMNETVKKSTAVAGRGDIKAKWIIACYFFVTLSYITVSGFMIKWNFWVMVVLLFFGLLYTPIIAYVTARLEGMIGQTVNIPYIREAAFILSGYRGITVWFLPVPLANYAGLSTFYRQCELTGTKFTSIWKVQLVLVPIILCSSLLFMNFIWHNMGPIPSQAFPFANKMWELRAAQDTVIQTSTLGEYSYFQEAFKPTVLGAGALFGLLFFTVSKLLGAPIMFAYGLLGGFNALPHMVIPQFCGALLGRYYFRRRMKDQWLQYITVVAAGFFCGTGLITVLGIGINFISKAVIQPPY